MTTICAIEPIWLVWIITEFRAKRLVVWNWNRLAEVSWLVEHFVNLAIVGWHVCLVNWIASLFLAYDDIATIWVRPRGWADHIPFRLREDALSHLVLVVGIFWLERLSLNVLPLSFLLWPCVLVDVIVATNHLVIRVVLKGQSCLLLDNVDVTYNCPNLHIVLGKINVHITHVVLLVNITFSDMLIRALFVSIDIF